MPLAYQGISTSRHAARLVCALRDNSSFGQSLATLPREMMFVPVPVDIACADEPFELFWPQLLAGELPF
jgi:hypothetical protein